MCYNIIQLTYLPILGKSFTLAFISLFHRVVHIVTVQGVDDEKLGRYNGLIFYDKSHLVDVCLENRSQYRHLWF